MEGSLEFEKNKIFIENEFTNNVLPSLMKYIEIPNLSKSFDSNWETNGLLEKAANFLINWVKEQNVKGLSIELLKDEGKSPLIFIEIEGTEKNCENVLLYGHFDKQPHFTGWNEGFGPLLPIIHENKLYGRGGADDGYSIYASILSIKACQVQQKGHGRVVVIIEGDEESGSKDLPHYLQKLKERIGNPSLIFCLDSGCLDYERLWLTTSLRGHMPLILNVKVLGEGVHSGDASGIVPSSFRIMRILLDRLENSKTGEVNEKLQVNIPSNAYEQLEKLADFMGEDIINKFPFHNNTKSTKSDIFQALLNKTWRPTVSITGADDLPPTEIAGNVLRKETTLKISIRLPPTYNPQKAFELVKDILEKDPPYNSEINANLCYASPGFYMKKLNSDLDKSISNASLKYFGKDKSSLGMGGSIPFMSLLQTWYPSANILVLGILGPQSNAHGPNESLHIPATKNLICCISQIIADFHCNFKNN